MADLSQDQVNAIHDALKVNPSLRKDKYALYSLQQQYGLDVKQMTAALSQKRLEHQVHRSFFGGATHWLGGVWRDITHLMSPTSQIAGMPGPNQYDPNYDIKHGELYKMGKGIVDTVKGVAPLVTPEGRMQFLQQAVGNVASHPWDLFLLPAHAWAGMASDYNRNGFSYALGKQLPYLLAGGFGGDALASTTLGRFGAEESAAQFAARRAAAVESQLAKDKEFLTQLMKSDVPYKDLPDSVRIAANIAERRVRMHEPLWFEKWMAEDFSSKVARYSPTGELAIDSAALSESGRLSRYITEREAELNAINEAAAAKAREAQYSYKQLGDARLQRVADFARSTVGKPLGSIWRGSRKGWRAANSPGANIAYALYLDDLKERDPKAYKAALQGNVLDANGNLNTIGAEVARLLGQDEGFFHTAIKHTIDFVTTFLSHDPYIIAGKYIKQGKSAYGLTGSLGKYFGGMAIHEAGDATRAYYQYSGFRRAVQFMADATAAEIDDAFRGVFSDSNRTLLHALGEAKTTQEVLSVFEDAVDGMALVGQTLPRLGWYSTFKLALKGPLGEMFGTLGTILQRDVEITDEIYSAVKEQVGLDIRPRNWLYAQSPPALKANVLFRQRVYRQFLRTPEWYNNVTREMTNNAIVPGSIESVRAFGDMAGALGLPRVTILAMQDAMYQTLGNREAFYKTYRNVMHMILSRPLHIALQGAEYEAIADQLDTFVMEKVDMLIGGQGGSVEGVYGAGRDSFQVILKEGRQVRAAIGSSHLATLRLPTSREMRQYQRTILNTVTKYRSHESETALREWRSTFKQLSELARFSPATNEKVVSHLRAVLKSRAEGGEAMFESAALRSGYMPKFEQLLKKYALSLSKARRTQLTNAERLASVLDDLQNEVRTAQQRYQMAADQITMHLDVTPASVPLPPMSLEEAAALADTTREALETLAERMRGEMMAAEDMMAEIKAMLNASPDAFSRVQELASAMAAASGRVAEERTKYAKELARRWTETTDTNVRNLSRWLRFWGENGKRGVRNNRDMITDLMAAYLNKVFKPLALATIGWAERVTASEFMLNMFRHEGHMMEAMLSGSIARIELSLGESISSKEKAFLRNMFASFVLGVERGVLEQMGSKELNRMTYNAMRLWTRNGATQPGAVHGTAGTLDALTEDTISQALSIDASANPVVTNVRRGKNFTMMQYTDEGAATGYMENLQRVAHDDILAPVIKAVHAEQRRIATEAFAANEEALMPTVIREAVRRLENGTSSVSWRARNEAVQSMRNEIFAQQSFRDATLAEQQVVLDYLESIAKTPEEIVAEDLPRYMQGPYDAVSRNIAALEDRLLANEKTIADLENQVLEYEAVLRSNFAYEESSMLNEEISKELDTAERELRTARSASAILDKQIKEHAYRSTYMLLEHGATLRPYKEVLVTLRQELAENIQNMMNEAELRVRELTGEKKLVLPRLGSADFHPDRIGSFLDADGNVVPNQELWDKIFQQYPELWAEPDVYGNHFVVGMPGALNELLATSGLAPADIGTDAIAHIGSMDLQALGLQAPRNFERLPKTLAEELDDITIDPTLHKQTVLLSDGTEIEIENLRVGPRPSIPGMSEKNIAELKQSIKLENSVARQLDIPMYEAAIDGDYIFRAPEMIWPQRISEHQTVATQASIHDYDIFKHARTPNRYLTGPSNQAGVGRITDVELRDLRQLRVFESIMGYGAKSTEYFDGVRVRGMVGEQTAGVYAGDKAEILNALEGVIYSLPELQAMDYRIGRLIGTNKYERETIAKIQEAWKQAYNEYLPQAKKVKSTADEFYGQFPGLKFLYNSSDKFAANGGTVEIIRPSELTDAETNALTARLEPVAKKADQDLTKAKDKLFDEQRRLYSNSRATPVTQDEQNYLDDLEHEVQRLTLTSGALDNALTRSRVKSANAFALGVDGNGEIVGCLTYNIDNSGNTPVFHVGLNGGEGGSGAAQLIAAIKKEYDENGIRSLDSSATTYAWPWHARAGRIMAYGSQWNEYQIEAIIHRQEEQQFQHFIPFPSDLRQMESETFNTYPAANALIARRGLNDYDEPFTERWRTLSNPTNTLQHAETRAHYRFVVRPEEQEKLQLLREVNHTASDLARALDFPVFDTHSMFALDHRPGSPTYGDYTLETRRPHVEEDGVKPAFIDLMGNPDRFMADIASHTDISARQIKAMRMMAFYNRLISRDLSNAKYTSFEHTILRARWDRNYGANYNSMFEVATHDFEGSFDGNIKKWVDDIVRSFDGLGITRDEFDYVASRIASMADNPFYYGDIMAVMKQVWRKVEAKVKDDGYEFATENPYSFVPTYGRINTPSESDVMRWFGEVHKQVNYRHSLSSSLRSMLKNDHQAAYNSLMKVDPSTVTRMHPLVDPIAGRSEQSRMFNTQGVPPEIVLGANRNQNETLSDLALHLRRQQATQTPTLFNKRIAGSYTLGDDASFRQFLDDFKKYKNSLKNESDPEHEAAVEWFTKFIGGEPDSWQATRARDIWSRQADLMRSREASRAERKDYMDLVKKRAALGRERSAIGLRKRNAIRRAQAVPSVSDLEEAKQAEYNSVLERLAGHYDMQEKLSSRLEASHARRARMEDTIVERDARLRESVAKKVAQRSKAHIRANMRGFGKLVRSVNSRMDTINNRISDEAEKVIDQVMSELARKEMSGKAALDDLRNYMEQFAYQHLASMPEEQLLAYDRAFYPLAENSTGDPLMDFARAISEHLMTLVTSSAGNKYFPEIVEQMATGRIGSARTYAKWFSEGIQNGEGRPSNFPAREFLSPSTPGMTNLFVRGSEALHRNVLSKIVNNVIRNPLFVLEYHNQMEHLTQHIIKGVYTREQAEIIAEAAALKNMMRYVHDPLGKTNWENNMRIVAPFYFAKNQAMRRAIRVAGDDVAAFYKYLRLNLAITDFVATNQDGSHTTTMPGSEIISGLGVGMAGVLTHLTSGSLNQGNLTNSMNFGFDGSPTSVVSMVITGAKPGAYNMIHEAIGIPFGPIVTFPSKLVNEYVALHNPMVEHVFRLLLGETAMRTTAMDDLLPNTLVRNTVKGIWGFTQQDKVSTYASTEAWVIQDIAQQKFNQFYEQAALLHPSLSSEEMAMYGSREQLWTYYAIRECGKWMDKNKAELQHNANMRTAVLYGMKILSSFALPVAVSVGERFTANDQFRAILQERDEFGSLKYPTYILAADEFMRRYPNHILDLISHTRYGGARYPETKEAYDFFGKHFSTVAEYPNISAYFIPEGGATFDSDALRVEYALGLRERQAPSEFIKSINIMLGNRYYGIMYDKYKALPGAVGPDGRLTYEAAMRLKSDMFLYGQTINADWMADKNSGRKNAFAHRAYLEMQKFLGDKKSTSIIPESDIQVYKYLIAQRENYEQAFRDAAKQGLSTGKLSSAWYDYCTALSEDATYAKYAAFIIDVLQHLPKPE